ARAAAQTGRDQNGVGAADELLNAGKDFRKMGMDGLFADAGILARAVGIVKRGVDFPVFRNVSQVLEIQDGSIDSQAGVAVFREGVGKVTAALAQSDNGEFKSGRHISPWLWRALAWRQLPVQPIKL